MEHSYTMLVSKGLYSVACHSPLHTPIHTLMVKNATQGCNLLISSNQVFSVLLKDTSTPWRSRGRPLYLHCRIELLFKVMK